MPNAQNEPGQPISPLARSASSAERAIGNLTVLLESWRFPILIVLSVLYFWSTAFRAERKLYWFDEIITVQISKQPNLHHIWTALTHAADANPPLIYFLTGFSQHMLGNTGLANRMPEIIAFWVFCLSLYWFTYRFAGAGGALAALLFPLVTIAYWYSYEARPHALVLGFAGLAAVCWQRTQVKKHRTLWLIGLGLSLGFVLLSHAFGLLVFFPIALAEIVDLIVTRQFRPGAWIAMFCGGLAILVSVALLPNFKTSIGNLQSTPGIGMIIHTYLVLLDPAAMVLGLVLCATLIPWKNLRAGSFFGRERLSARDRLPGKVTPAEGGLIVGCLLIPVACFTLAFANRAPMFSRYSLEAVFGFGCVVALSSARSGVVPAIVAIILIQCGQNFVSFRHRLQIQEPDSSLIIDANFSEFAKRYTWMIDAGRTDLPIVLIDRMDFAPTIYYAPAELRKRMVFAWKGDSELEATLYSRLIRFTGAGGSVMRSTDLLRTHPTFLLFAAHGTGVSPPLEDRDVVHQLLHSGTSITVLQAEGDMELLLVQSNGL